MDCLSLQLLYVLPQAPIHCTNTLRGACTLQAHYDPTTDKFLIATGTFNARHTSPLIVWQARETRKSRIVYTRGTLNTVWQAAGGASCVLLPCASNSTWCVPRLSHDSFNDLNHGDVQWWDVVKWTFLFVAFVFAGVALFSDRLH